MKDRKVRKTTEEKYLAIMSQIYQRGTMPVSEINDSIAEKKADKNIIQRMDDMGVISRMNGSCKWTGDRPTAEMAIELARTKKRPIDPDKPNSPFDAIEANDQTAKQAKEWLERKGYKVTIEKTIIL